MLVWRASVGVITALLMVALALSGCGDSPPASNGVAAKAPAEILAASRAAVANAQSVRVMGSIVDAGTPISLDMELIAGKGGRGRLALDGYTLQLVAADGGAYLKGSSAFFAGVLGPAGVRLRGRWLKAPVHRANFSWIGSLTSLSGLADTALEEHGAGLTKMAAKVDGRSAVAVSDAANGGTLYVAATGSPYPLALVTRGGGRLTFDRWNESVALEPPSGAVNISQLERRR